MRMTDYELDYWMRDQATVMTREARKRDERSSKVEKMMRRDPRLRAKRRK